MLLLRRKDRPAPCDGAVVVIALGPLAYDCPAGVPRITRSWLRRNGATAIWLDGQLPRILTDHTERGERPWTVQPPEAPEHLTLPLAPAGT